MQPATSANPPGVLEPWLPVLHDAVTRALRRLLGMPDDLPLQWQPDPRAPGWRAVVTVDTCTLLLGSPDPGRNPQWSGEHLALELRSGDHTDLLAPLLRRLRAVDRAGPAGPLLHDLREAWERWQPMQDLRDEDFRAWSPREALLRLGFRCNEDCDFCFQDRKWPQPPLERHVRWLTQMLDWGTREVILSGGEPTLYLDELAALAGLCRQRGAQVFLQTNGIRFSQPAILARVVDAGVVGASISYHSADPQVSDAATQAPGAHARTERGILAALRAGLQIDLNAVVDRRTLPGLAERSRRIVQTFLPATVRPGQLSTSFAFPSMGVAPQVYRRDVAPLDAITPLLTEALTLLLDAGLVVAPLGSCGFPLCSLRDVPALLDPERTTDLAAEHYRGRQHPPVCQGCALRESCIGPRREYLEVHGERGLVPFVG